jgi:energy-coupling factor transporter ATP-binding protein EcfA2
MIPTNIRIDHYRALRGIDVPLGDYTAMVGPNGVGKSTALDALDFFLSPAHRVDEDDLQYGMEDPISVTVTLTALNDEERTLYAESLNAAGDLVVTTLHGVKWIEDRQVMVVSVDAIESIYLYLVGCLQAAQKLRRADGDASIGQNAIDFLRSPSWAAYLRSIGERYREARKQLDDDRGYAERSFKKRETALAKSFYDLKFIRGAIDAVLAKRAVPSYAMPRNVRSLTQGGTVIPLRPVRAA